MTVRGSTRGLLWAALTVLTTASWAGTVTVTVVDNAGRPLTNAVVQLDSPQAAKRVKPAPTRSIVQRDKTFIPAVTVVPRGTALAFPNEDSVRHHVYSFSPAKRFELKLYAGTPSSPVVFDQAGLVVLGCNIHDQMTAWVHVVDTPHFGTTDGQGRTSLGQVPSGTYQLRAWHARLPEGQGPSTQTLVVTDAPLTVTVKLQGVTQP